MVMMVAASLCGATTATEFALFAENRKSALSQLIDYDSAPSHDTFSRLLRLMDPEAFARAFAVFAAGFAQALAEMEIGAGHVVALDGKTLRRAYERGQAASPPLTVSAFAAEARLCLTAATPNSEENEIEAAIKVVDLLDLTDKIVTADALHCHRRMAQAIVDRGGNYVLALKGNRPTGAKRRAKAWRRSSRQRPSTANSAMAAMSGEGPRWCRRPNRSWLAMPPSCASPPNATTASR
jgi:hypothetical protein